MIKAYSSDLITKQKELKSLPDVTLMESFANEYSDIVTRMKELEDFIYKLELYQSRIVSYDNIINDEQGELEKYKTQLLLLPLVRDAENKYIYLNTLDKLLKNTCDVMDDIFVENNKLNKHKAFVSLLPIVNDARFISNEIAELETCYNSAITVSNQVDSLQEHYYLALQYSLVLNNVLNNTNVLMQFVSYTMDNTNDIQTIEDNQTLTIKEMISQKKHIKSIKSSITKTQKNKNAFVLEYGICPCCGQNVTDEHVQAITTFMED